MDNCICIQEEFKMEFGEFQKKVINDWLDENDDRTLATSVMSKVASERWREV